MKHSDINIDPVLLAARLESAGMQTTGEQRDLLVRHAELVLEANKQMNLTRITEPEQVVELHIVDSVAFLSKIPPLEGPVVDMGSGAGFPGIPLCVVGHDVTLCESSKKKARFLEDAIALLGLGCTVAAVRAEELAMEKAGVFGSAVARALAGLPALLELSAPLVVLGGRLIALKGTPDRSERVRANIAAVEVGMRLEQTVSYQLAGGEERTVFVYKKIAQPRISLPRRPGMAQKQPLGAAKG